VTNPPWTAAEDAELRRLVADKLSARLIESHLGRTRSAVIGRCRRLRLKLHNRPNGISTLAVRRAAAPKPPPIPLPPPQPQPPEAGKRVSISDLANRHCRYIGERPELLTLDTPVYCGMPTKVGSSWCPWHRKQVLRPLL
jgi:hypothetical protein